MREVLADLLAWWREGRPVGVATVVATWRSAPRPAGASMLVGPDGHDCGLAEQDVGGLMHRIGEHEPVERLHPGSGCLVLDRGIAEQLGQRDQAQKWQ